MKCKDCKFYNNKETNDFGRNYKCKCDKNNYTSTEFENSSEEYRGIELLQERCSLKIRDIIVSKLNELTELLKNGEQCNGIYDLIDDITELIYKL